MRNLSTLVLLLFTSLLASSQNNLADSIRFSFYGFHSTTQYYYVFYVNGKVECNENGHIGFGLTNGNYHILNDTIFIDPLPGFQQVNPYYCQYRRSFFIDTDTSIVDLDIYFDYRRLQLGENDVYNSKRRSKIDIRKIEE